MNRDELLARLHSIEWNDIEFKEASWAVPKDALSTVSAFANTTGGHLVFGVRQENGQFTISGVIDADKVQNDFLGQVRDQKKISVFLPIDGQVHAVDESTVIVFYVPEAQRGEKPVFLDGNPQKTYIRRGGRDDTCTRDELICSIRDASNSPYDGDLLPDFSVEHCFDETTVRWYPGDAFVSREQLIDPGQKPVRNPSIVAAFRRIGLSDQAGSGMGAIFEGWRRLGNVPPIIENDKVEKTFRLILPKDRLLTEAQLLAQASLGVNLSEQEAAVFAYLTRKGQIDLADVKALTGLNGPGARGLVQRLTVQALLAPASEGGSMFTLAQHLRARFLPARANDDFSKQSLRTSDNPEATTEQVTVQVATYVTEQVPRLVQLSAVQWLIVEHADTPRTLKELLAISGYKQRPHFKAHHLEPLLAGGVLRMTVPDTPTSSRQQYVLTEIGIKLKAMYGQKTATIEQEAEQ